MLTQWPAYARIHIDFKLWETVVNHFDAQNTRGVCPPVAFYFPEVEVAINKGNLQFLVHRYRCTRSTFHVLFIQVMNDTAEL